MASQCDQYRYNVGVDQERNFTEPVEEPFIKGPLFVCLLYETTGQPSTRAE
jgi:hypothetical protein